MQRQPGKVLSLRRAGHGNDPLRATRAVPPQRTCLPLRHFPRAVAKWFLKRKTLRRIAAQQPEVEVFSRAMTNEPAVISEVLQRALASSAVRAEGEREAEADAALATYLWPVSNHRRDLAQTAAGSLHEWRQFFWARKLADDLRLPDGSAKGNGREATAERTGEATEDAEALHRKP
jgi:hypothetical protein